MQKKTENDPEDKKADEMAEKQEEKHAREAETGVNIVEGEFSHEGTVEEVPEEGLSELEALQAQVLKLQEELAESRNNLLRKHADFENFRKRMSKEKEDSIRYANQMVLLDITDTIDNFERAMKSAEESKDFDAFHNGVVLIEKQLISMLENKWGLKRFASEGEPFDPERHQAIAVEDSSEYEVETVLEDFQKGYLYNDRVLRPAKVKVSKPVAGDETENNTEQQ